MKIGEYKPEGEAEDRLRGGIGFEDMVIPFQFQIDYLVTNPEQAAGPTAQPIS